MTLSILFVGFLTTINPVIGEEDKITIDCISPEFFGQEAVLTCYGHFKAGVYWIKPHGDIVRQCGPQKKESCFTTPQGYRSPTDDDLTEDTLVIKSLDQSHVGVWTCQDDGFEHGSHTSIATCSIGATKETATSSTAVRTTPTTRITRTNPEISSTAMRTMPTTRTTPSNPDGPTTPTKPITPATGSTAGPTTPTTPDDKTTTYWILAAIAGFLLLCLIGAIVRYLIKKRKKHKDEDNPKAPYKKMELENKEHHTNIHHQKHQPHQNTHQKHKEYQEQKEYQEHKGYQQHQQHKQHKKHQEQQHQQNKQHQEHKEHIEHQEQKEHQEHQQLQQNNEEPKK
ncbi:G-box-binding factor-like [Gigantopelta aegis]|uniref:G-box-binding factor-like n=1 Tax=Gigantopelta aegis TaxID=1735272 RepID=UPI001B88BB4A|nr:G-box-binding factor-like [Gigantopelta aegis]